MSSVVVVGAVVVAVILAFLMAFRFFFLSGFLFLSATSCGKSCCATLLVESAVVLISAAWAPVISNRVAHSPLAVIVSQLRYLFEVFISIGLSYKNDYHHHFSLAAGYTKLVHQYRLMTMEINKLTIAACSGSILAATLFGTPSQGMPLQHNRSGEGQLVSLATRHGNKANIRQPNEQGQSLLSASDRRRLQIAAVTKFGCGCPNCVSAIRELVRSGESAI